ncbi:MAG: SsrA-binding protein SmpB [Rickettsiaceae bacterium]|nr:SsrA-binding protein SmpB [Rickettsiaceae bacterium]
MNNKQPLEKKTIIATNRRARFEYFIEDKFETGISLLGSEVKALRQGKVSLEDAYVLENNNEMCVINMHIGYYDKAYKNDYANKRQRKLLLHRKEINKIIGKIKQKGFSSVPLSIYFNSRNLAKLEIALVKGKQLHDKREALKQKDWNREQHRLLKSNG